MGNYDNSVTVIGSNPSDAETLAGAITNDFSSLSIGIFGLVGISGPTAFTGSGYLDLTYDSKTGGDLQFLGEANAGPIGVGVDTSGQPAGFLSQTVDAGQGSSFLDGLGVGTFVQNGSVGNFIGTSNAMIGFYVNFNNTTDLQQAINQAGGFSSGTGAAGTSGSDCTDPSVVCAESREMKVE